ncbi:MAG: hypothetical protein JKZ03_03685 [Flavobacteriaceae bacterium]|nr:hypothetical protein [Flavobacteriaceae bacterium]
MIAPNDIDYKETKDVINGQKKASEQIESLKKWIEDQFRLKVLHIFQDHLDNSNQPRLNVILENYEDVEKFNDKTYNYDSAKQSMISERFSEINNEKSSNKSFIKRLFEKPKDKYFVCFSAFNPIAKSEIIGEIPDVLISEFKKRNQNEKIWEIHETFLGAIVFLYKDNDIEEYKNSDAIEKLKDDFYKMVKPFDKSGYFQRNKLNIGVDSKENFDNNYESNWYYYYK